jgi:uncharacterized membrane protein
MLALGTTGCPGKKDKKDKDKEKPPPAKEPSIEVKAPSEVKIMQGDEKDVEVTINRTNYEGEVTLTAAVPEKAKGLTVTPEGPTKKTEAKLKIKAEKDATADKYTIEVEGKGTGEKPPAPSKDKFTVVVEKKTVAPPSKDSIKLTVPSDAVEVKQGDSKEVKLALKREGDKAAGDVELKYKVDPKAKDKITIKKGDKIAKGSNDVTIEVHAAADAEPGTYDIAITASAGDGVPPSEGTLHVKVNKK